MYVFIIISYLSLYTTVFYMPNDFMRMMKLFEITNTHNMSFLRHFQNPYLDVKQRKTQTLHYTYSCSIQINFACKISQALLQLCHDL